MSVRQGRYASLTYLLLAIPVVHRFIFTLVSHDGSLQVEVVQVSGVATALALVFCCKSATFIMTYCCHKEFCKVFEAYCILISRYQLKNRK